MASPLSHDLAFSAAPDIDTLVENLPGNVYRRVRRPDGTYVFEYLSNGLFRQFGVDHRRLLAAETVKFEWVHPDDRPRFVADLELSAATLGLLDHRVRVVGHDGRVHWARGIARPTRRADGSVVWDGIVIDVTREIEAEAALRVAKEEADRAHRDATETIATAFDRLHQLLRTVATVIDALEQAHDTDPRWKQRLRGIAAEISGSVDAPFATALPTRPLTPRQADVLALVRAGASNKVIAQTLGITPGTAKLHVATVLRALGVRSRREVSRPAPEA